MYVCAKAATKNTNAISGQAEGQGALETTRSLEEMCVFFVVVVVSDYLRVKTITALSLPLSSRFSRPHLLLL